MCIIVILIAICVWLQGVHTVSLSISVDNGDIQMYNAGDVVDVRVGTGVLLIADFECEWNWDIVNANSQSLTTQSSGIIRLLHIVPFTREEMGVYSCDYFDRKQNLTLIATGSNLFRRYGGKSIEAVRNNSVVLATINRDDDTLIYCVQSTVLSGIGRYWQGPDGSDVANNGSIYMREIAERGESVLVIQASNNVAEGVYTCITDNNDSYKILVYRDVYAIVRGNGERELLNMSREIVHVSIGEEISLICPEGSVPDYHGENEGRIEKLFQILYIPLFTYNEAGIYHCKSGLTDDQVELIAINSALIYTWPSPVVLANNSFISIMDDVMESVVCAGSRSGNGNYTGWYLNGERIPVFAGLTGESQLVRYNQLLGGLELYLAEVTAMYQGEYMCEANVLTSTGSIAVERQYVSVYLQELELVLVSDTGVDINHNTVIFLKSTTIRDITCKSAEFYLDTVSVNWTADSIMFRLENNTIQLSNLSQSSLYTCHAANPFSTGSISVYILSDTLNANLTVTYNNRKVEAYGSDVIIIELDVGLQNVVIECTAFQAVLTLPWGEMRSDGMSLNTVTYTIPLVTPDYNGVVSCMGVSHEVTRVNITTVGAVLVRERSTGITLLESGITVIEETEYFICIGSDVTAITEWNKSGRNSELFVRVSVYEEILRFEPNKTPEGYYTCLARNESGGVETFTQGLFNAQPYGPNINIYVNGTNTSVYVLTSNAIVSLECEIDSYPPALSILWYTGDQLIGNTSKIDLNITNNSIALLCVVSTVFRTKQQYVYIINPFTNITITNTTIITPQYERSTGILVVLLLTLLIVVFVPIAVIPTYVFIHKLIPAEILLYWRERKRGSVDRGDVVAQFEEYKLTKVEYKNRYKLNELEENLEEVKFWESKTINEEYEELKRAALVGTDVYHSVQPVRMTSKVYVEDDLTQVTHKQNDVCKADTVSIAESSTNVFVATDNTPLLEVEDRNVGFKEDIIESSWEAEHIRSMLNIDECPGFFIVKGLFGNIRKQRNNGKKRNNEKKRADAEKERIVNYLNFLFHRKPDDVVFIGYSTEDSAAKFSEFVFYPHGPKDKRVKVKNDKKGKDERVYYISTISYFSSKFYTMRQLVIREEKKNSSLEIRLFNFLTWPQVEIGSKTYPFIEFVLSFWCKKQTPFRKKSIVLHCDAGARCATFISIYYLLRRTRKDETFNLFEFFVKLYNQGREKGLELFPTHTQYEFLHSIILDLTLTSTTCQSGELDSKFKKLFELPRDYNPWREDRVEIFMKTLDELVIDASKDLKKISEEREIRNTELDEKYQKQQKKRADRHESEKEIKDKKKEPEQTGFEKEEETYRSDDEIEYVEDRGKFVSSLTGNLIPEALFIKTDTAANRFRKERKQRTNIIKSQKDPFDETENSKKEYKQLKLYRPYLLNTFANSPAYTHYRTHKKHLEGGREEAVEEQNNKENGKKGNLRLRKDIFTNKRPLNIEEKLSMDECTRYELFLFGAGQVQVYGPNITDENQSQGFWLHSIYGEEIIATRHPSVNDFEYANHNNPQFNLHLYKQQRISTVIALCTFEELIEAYTAKKKLRYDNSKRDGKQPMSPYWPPIGQDENFGPFKVKTVAAGHIDDKKLMQWFDLEYKDTKDMDGHSIKVFLCKDWPTLMETNHTTGRHDRFVQFMTKVVAYTKESRSEKLAIHCSDTKPYSAQFSAVFYALRQNDTEGKIDMYQIAKGIQISRRHSSGFVTEDQYFLSMALTSDCLLSVTKSNEENELV